MQNLTESIEVQKILAMEFENEQTITKTSCRQIDDLS